jgi:hypothetical protein
LPLWGFSKKFFNIFIKVCYLLANVKKNVRFMKANIWITAINKDRTDSLWFYHPHALASKISWDLIVHPSGKA